MSSDFFFMDTAEKLVSIHKQYVLKRGCHIVISNFPQRKSNTYLQRQNVSQNTFFCLLYTIQFFFSLISLLAVFAGFSSRDYFFWDCRCCVCNIRSRVQFVLEQQQFGLFLLEWVYLSCYGCTSSILLKTIHILCIV